MPYFRIKKIKRTGRKNDEETMRNRRRNVERVREDMRGQGVEKLYKGFRKEMRQGRNKVI